MRLLFLPIALALAGPALAGAPLDGDWDCKAGREIVGMLTIDGARYTLGEGSGALAPPDAAVTAILDGPLADDWHLSQLLLESVDGAEVLRLQVTAMYAPRSIGNCMRPTP